MEGCSQSYEKEQYKNTGEKDGELNENFRGVKTYKDISFGDLRKFGDLEKVDRTQNTVYEGGQ